MKKIILIICTLISVNVQALDNLPQTVEVSKPKILDEDLLYEKNIREFESMSDWGQSKPANAYWIVFSDRNDNVTYHGPSDKTERFGTLRFNEEVRIARIKNGYALVYVEQVPGVSYPKIHTPIKKGWVPMKNLLLWSSCPANSMGIYHKALPVVNIDEYMKGKGTGAESQMFKVYDNPSAKTNPKKLKASLDFYFIMKEDKSSGLVLLSKRNLMHSGALSQVLYGWVNKASYVSWNQRACLEPNFDPEVVEKFENEHKSIPVYFNKQCSDLAVSMPIAQDNRLGQRSTRFRLRPYDMRYPLLENDSQRENEGVQKVTCFVGGPSGRGPVIGQDSTITELQNTAIKETRHVNIIMVIDATSSMKEFYPTIQKIVSAANTYFNADKRENTVRVGVVLYRDYPDGAYCTEYMRLTSPENPELAKFLLTGGKYGIRSVAKSATEALQKGVEVALDPVKMGFSSKNANMMFIIGDCGNDPEDKKSRSIADLVNQAVSQDMMVSAFQVYNPNDASYKLFRQNTNELLQGIVEGLWNLKRNDQLNIKWEPRKDGFEFKMPGLNDDQRFFIGNTRRPAAGQKLELAKLYDIIKDSYIQLAQVVNFRVASILNNPDFFDLEDNKSASAQANRALWEKLFDAKDLKKFQEAGLIQAKIGYTYQKDPVSKFDNWKPVIYISKAEYNELMGRLQPVMAAAEEGSQSRLPYVEAMKELTKTLYGDISESRIMSMDTKQIMALVAGLPVKSDALGGRTLMQIEDNKVVSEDEFNNLISVFQDKYRKLDRIKNGYKYSVELPGDTWYWIPVEDLP